MVTGNNNVLSKIYGGCLMIYVNTKVVSPNKFLTEGHILYYVLCFKQESSQVSLDEIIRCINSLSQPSLLFLISMLTML